MKKFCSALAAALLAVGTVAGYEVQTLVPGTNVYFNAAARVVALEAVATSASGSITVAKVTDGWTYSTNAVVVPYTNTYANATLASNQVVTVSTNLVDLYAYVTNSVRTVTNVTGVAGANISTNVVNIYDVDRRAAGVGTNVVTSTNWVYSLVSAPVRRAFTNMVDTVSHQYSQTSVGSITLANHVGTLAPQSTVYIAPGDLVVIGASGLTGVAVRLYTDPE